ncbi:Transglycosylase SLT domain-containing protein [Pectobacterium carotovorum]|nr:Transglycosylase SLT domain-containing protein [Pectobacterium carotovorum]
MRIMILSLFFISCSAFSQSKYCFSDAAKRYSIDALLLIAIASQESGMNPSATNKNRNKQGVVVSIDIGVMQINSYHLKRLAAMGITEKALFEPCQNIMVGSYILAEFIARNGVSWESIGAYNAGLYDSDEKKRLRIVYAKIIYANYLTLLTKNRADIIARAERGEKVI